MSQPLPNEHDLVQIQPNSAHLAASTTDRLTHSVEEVAVILGVSRHTVYRLLTRRLLRSLPGLRVKRVTDQSVKKYLNSAF